MSEAVLAEEPRDEAAADSGPCCEKCGLPTKASACPRCGWYPSLGIHVDIDNEFEAVMNAEAPVEASAEAATPANKPEWQKHLDVWSGLIPGWAWFMLATTAGVVGAGVATRLVANSNPSLQMWCGVGGLVSGLLVMALAHLIGFVFCSFDDADFGVTDLIIKPMKTWKQILSGLPNRLWLANSANLGLSTALTSALIIGGIPYDRLLDWGFKAPPKKSLLAAVTEQAAREGGADNLEDAIGDFAGQAGNVGEAGDAAAAPVAEKPRQRLECLIIGYQTDRDGNLNAFLLASDVTGKLKYVGRVAPEITKVEERELLEKFENNISTRPFVKSPQSGTWLRPRFTCRVTYTEWPQGRRPQDLEWDALLDEVKLPW